jgi:hypothetical protein
LAWNKEKTIENAWQCKSGKVPRKYHYCKRHGAQSAIADRVAQIRAEMEASTSITIRKSSRRVCKAQRGVALSESAPPEIEMKEKKVRIVDALNALRRRRGGSLPAAAWPM